jgi:hypothetical protein
VNLLLPHKVGLCYNKAKNFLQPEKILLMRYNIYRGFAAEAVLPFQTVLNMQKK